MRVFLVAATVLTCLLCGCANVREVDIDAGGSRLQEITENARGRVVSVELRDGRVHEVEDLSVGAETTCWKDRDRFRSLSGRNEPNCVPTSEVSRVIIPRRVRGALQGAGLGLGAGAAVFGAAALVQQLSDSIAISEGGGFLLYLIPATPVIGGAVGAAKGEDIYVLSP